MFRIKSILTFALICLVSSPAFGQLVTYRIKVKTSDEAWSRTMTPNRIILVGDRGVSQIINLVNSHHDGATDVTTKPIADIGIVHTIQLLNKDALVPDASPNWQVDWVRVLREHSPGSIETDFTTSLFYVGQWLEVNQPQVFTAPEKNITGLPAVTVTATGRVKQVFQKVTLVKFKENLSSAEQSVSQLTEFWSRETSVGWVDAFENGTETGFGVEASLESPFGGVSASVSQAWSSVRTRETNSSTTRVSGSEINWAFLAAPYSYTFRLIELDIPRQYTQYQESAAPENTAWLRQIGDQINGISRELFIEVPTPEKINDPNSGAHPANWNLIESQLLPHMTLADRSRVLALKTYWLNQGVIYEQNAQQTVPITPGTTTVTPQETPPSAEPIIGSFRIRCAGNGRNLHLDGRGDKLVSTRSAENDVWTVFFIKGNNDGTGNYRISSMADKRLLHVNGSYDKLVSTRWDVRDAFTNVRLEQQGDGTYRIRSAVPGGGYLYVNGYGDQLLSTRLEVSPDDSFSRFELIPE